MHTLTRRSLLKGAVATAGVAATGLAGRVFAAEQGGVYSSPRVAALIARVRGLGVPAVGQSSWGPTVFALTPDVDRADWLAGQLATPDLEFVTVTCPASTGATVLVY